MVALLGLVLRRRRHLTYPWVLFHSWIEPILRSRSNIIVRTRMTWTTNLANSNLANSDLANSNLFKANSDFATSNSDFVNSNLVNANANFVDAALGKTNSVQDY